MLIFGVDPGQKGAVVAMDKNTLEVVDKWPMDRVIDAVTEARMRAIDTGVMIIIEAAQPMPKQGVVSVFTYGKGYGKLIGWFEALGLPYQEVKSSVWTKELFKGIPSHLEKKERNREAFRRLYPELFKEVAGRTGKPHEGIMDACLIARWGCRNSV